MPRTCSICKHKQLEEINQAIVAGQSLRNISQQFSVNYSAVNRHKKNCLPASLVKSKKAEEVAHADDLIGQLITLNRETMLIFGIAKKSKDFELALKAISRAEKQLELQAKLLGELQQEGTIKVQVLVPVLIEILTSEIHDPDILERVAAKLGQIENINCKAVKI
jgi:hypothetical protein